MKTGATDNEGHNSSDALINNDGRDQSTLPDFDASVTTRYACIGAIIFGAFACLACFITSIIIIVIARVNFKSKSGVPIAWGISLYLRLSTAAIEVLALAVNFILTLCLEGLAFVHATSLRWALYRENRLHFNTNLRLLTSAKSCGPNKWYINVISAICLILCYVATSQIFIAADEDSVVGLWDRVLINPIALLVLGTCLLCYVVIAIWAMKWNHRHVPTWSSAPVTNTLAALHKHLTHQNNRCLMPVHSTPLPSGPTFPSDRQLSLLSAIPRLSYLTTFIWTLTFLSLVWWLSIVLVSRSIIVNHHHFIRWYFTLSWYRDYPNDGVSDAVNSVPVHIFSATSPTCEGCSNMMIPQYTVALIFMTAIQGLQTIGLHCIELVVNATRDEDLWRRAAAPFPRRKSIFSSSQTKGGLPHKLNPLSSTLESLPYLYLFTLKAVLHWSLGQSVLPRWSPAGITFHMTHGRIFVYLVLACSLAVFTQYLCVRRPRGSQPATWGHLQTLADLIDDWGDGTGEGRLYWGDKGDGGRRDGVRHAGTSGKEEAVGRIRRRVLYE